jgi:hypothetical protein
MDHSKSRARRCAIYTRKSSEEGLEQDFKPASPARSQRSVHQEPGERGLEIHQDRVRRWWNVGRHHGATGATTAASRYRRGSSRCSGCLQGRSAHSLAGGLRQDGRDVRCARGIVRGGDPAVQHHHLYGQADAETCCSPSPSSSGRSPESAYATNRSLQAQGHLDGGCSSAGI